MTCGGPSARALRLLATVAAVVAPVAALGATSETSCKVDTNGTCGYLACDRSRGRASCVAGKCICDPGHCVDPADGACKLPGTTCSIDTGGTCRLQPCSAWRGLTAVCVNSACLCQDGSCASHGKCIPEGGGEAVATVLAAADLASTTGVATTGMAVAAVVAPVVAVVTPVAAVVAPVAALGAAGESSCEVDTNGTCGYLACDRSRGRASCVAGKCICDPGHCVDLADGACKLPGTTCNIDTGGTCRLQPCSAWRGLTAVCVNSACLCQDGSCASHGKCIPGGGGEAVASALAAADLASSTTGTTLLACALLMPLAAVGALRAASWRASPLEAQGNIEEPLLAGAD